MPTVFFFELLITLYRILRQVVLISFSVIFFSFNVFQFPLEASNPILVQLFGLLITSLFFSLGWLFLGQVGFKIFTLLRKAKPPVAAPRWRYWWLCGLALALVVHSAVIVFDGSVVAQRLLDSTLSWWWLAVLTIGVASVYYFAFVTAAHFLAARSPQVRLSLKHRWIRSSLLGLTIWINLLPFLAVLVLMIELFIDPLGPVPGQDLHTLHAAIKNTCLSEARENCPQRLEEIGYIEPKTFGHASERYQFQYQYDPDTNQYTLIVRYHPLKAAIFDQRLKETKGVDFADYTVSIWGIDRVDEPPAHLPTPTFPDWPYHFSWF